MRFPGLDGKEPVVVTNPLSAELSEMRRSLLPGLLAALRFNLNREAASFHAFEIRQGLRCARRHPGRGRTARGGELWRLRDGRGRPSSDQGGFWTGKGIVEAYLKAIGHRPR